MMEKGILLTMCVALICAASAMNTRRYAKVGPTFPPEVMGTLIQEIPIPGVIYKSACPLKCNRESRCNLVCSKGDMCSLFTNKVSRYYTGYSGSPLVAFDACYTSWITNPRRVQPISTSASSVGAGSDPKKAVNGFITSVVSHSFSSTLELGPWWVADLGYSLKVAMVRVHTRQDGTSGDFDSVEVRLGDSPTHSSNPVFDSYSGQPHNAAEVVFMPKEVMSGQFLSLQSMSVTPTTLSICDVEIIPYYDGARNMKRSCIDLLKKGNQASGVYRIYLERKVFTKVYCDMNTEGGGWTLIQRRRDLTPREDFSRNWNDYAHGFGDMPSGEFWLGNENIHRLTSQGQNELRIDLSDFTGETRWAKYTSFQLAGASDFYRLAASGYTGTAGNALNYHVGAPFSTIDKDNDNAPWNCASTFPGGWWYQECLSANLNGPYLSGPHTNEGQGVVWMSWLGLSYSLNTSSMLIRPVL